MAVKRQDAWTTEDDLILAEITLRHIREGGTQLSAFEEVAERLGRTPAACGFRWNSAVRKQYDAAIQIAKSQRQKRSQERVRISSTSSLSHSSVNMSQQSMPRIEFEEYQEGSDPVYSLDHIIRYLRQHKNEMTELKRQQKQLEKELMEREEYLARLQHENQEMKNQLNHVERDYRMVNDDYRMLVQIMDRARKLSILSEEEEEAKSRFRMEANGNLERVDK
ncbi:RsfA family transcriptional regulator [Thermoactinomyces sp. DSM 45892]|uniref:RsfA family transcriptional regulator n=1 Tax=Thermoactinomyces sp. DSM 45892 TaxID=1882753 RepID=UPI00089C15A5|nr:RsfA family transcriptional regulator [Thermoactinomyces sp. DSM 45892]SDY61395.1 prespore-specific regulator [Thermoactinomyces sp. DSM 45892]